jgi:MOSC domain-containing protein
MSARGSGTVVGTVAALRRYPVKSLGGEDLPVAEVREGGVVGDRTHAVVDRRTGKVGSAKNPRLWRALLAMSATACPDVGASGDGDGRGRAPEVSIMLPGGATVSSSDPRVHELLSEVLGRPVRLADERPPGAEIERADPLAVLAHGVDAEVPIVVGSLDQRDGHPPRPASFVDYAPVHLLTSATLEGIASLHPDGAVDLRRYRPNLVVRTVPGVAGFVESRWVGGRLRIGARLIVRVAVNTPRCAIPTLAHGELPRDTNALRMLADHNRLPVPGRAEVACAGVYAQVVEPGTIRHGDQVRLLPSDGDR